MRWLLWTCTQILNTIFAQVLIRLFGFSFFFLFDFWLFWNIPTGLYCSSVLRLKHVKVYRSILQPLPQNQCTKCYVLNEYRPIEFNVDCITQVIWIWDNLMRKSLLIAELGNSEHSFRHCRDLFKNFREFIISFYVLH